MVGTEQETRVDRWVWAVRLYKTRSAATTACRGGHVRINGRTAKPAATVRAGDRVEATVGQRRKVLEVVRVIDARVGAPIAAECYLDRTPPDVRPVEAIGGVPIRDRGTGRPTKKDRRQLDRHRRR